MASANTRGLVPVAPAGKQALIRRATFDLTGLPPTPEEIEAFVVDDDPGAFSRVVDRLLASPRYGEKWGRSWLDVARYADTAGETADIPVLDAWRYRNYVIDAFNDDMPYDQFLREQLAGDLLAADLPADAPAERYASMVTATGYLALARRFGFDTLKDHYLTIEDTIDTLGKSMLGLTIGCARCHDHKYDPIPTEDYYALYGIFESTRYPFSGCEKDRAPRDMVPLISGPEIEKRREELRRELAEADSATAATQARLKQRADAPAMVLASGEIPNGGEQILTSTPNADKLRSVAVQRGESIRLTILPRNGHGADSTGVDLTLVEQSGQGRTWNLTTDVLRDAGRLPRTLPDGQPAPWHAWDATESPRPFTEYVNDADGTAGLTLWRGAQPLPALFVNAGDQLLAFQTVRQPPRSIALHPGPIGGVAIAWESPVDGVVSVDGRVLDIDPSGGDGIAWTLTKGPGFGRELTESAAPLAASIRLKRALDSVAGSTPTAYAVVDGQPHDAELHVRGDPETRGKPVSRHFLKVLGGQPLTKKSQSGRRELAIWITDRHNPLTARVMVNRVWQGHFGFGLVRTPNNFGVRGESPTHPQLIDWLASQFMDNGWSIKSLHRSIMLSDAYQRSSLDDPANAAIDPENLGLWRFDRRRLSAEEIRDAMLAVSGDLDLSPAEAHPFPPPATWQFTQHSPFTAVYETNRRSVYLMTQRIKRHPFLALFDGADPNSSTGRRESSTVPTQALFFLNDPFVQARAESLVRRLDPLPDDSARLARAYSLCFGRAPEPREVNASDRFRSSYAEGLESADTDERHSIAWSAWIRIMLASNEFLYVD
jgi:hypothetical protein